MPTPFKVSRSVHVDSNPSAECRTEGCSWQYAESARTLQAVKDHVGQTGHSVLMTRDSRSLYVGHAR